MVALAGLFFDCFHTKRLRPVIGRSLRIRFTTCYTALSCMEAHAEVMRLPSNGGMPSAATGGRACAILLSRLLGSDFRCPSTGAGLTPSPARWGFPGTATLFVMAFAVCLLVLALAIIAKAFLFVKGLPRFPAHSTAGSGMHACPLSQKGISGFRSPRCPPRPSLLRIPPHPALQSV